MPKTVMLAAARTPIGKLGGGLASLDATELGGAAIKAALERAEVAPEQVQHVVMGQVLQAGQGQIPSRQAQIKAGSPKRSPRRRSTRSRFGDPGFGAARCGDPRRRPRSGSGRRDGIDVKRALPAQGGALRLSHGRRQGDRLDDQRRAHEPVLGQAHGPGGERGRQRARADATGHGPVGAALASAGDQGHGRGPVPEEIVAITVKGKKSESVVEVDEGPRRDTSLETLAKLPRDLRQGRLSHRGQLPGRQRRWRRGGSGQ